MSVLLLRGLLGEECYSSKDISQAVFPFEGATVGTYGQSPIYRYSAALMVASVLFRLEVVRVISGAWSPLTPK